MKPVKMSDLMESAAADKRWRRKLRILLAAGAVAVIGGITAIGVAGYYVVSATTAAIQSPAVGQAADEAIAQAESLRGALAAGDCLTAIEASLEPSRWIERPISENVALLKAGCLGVGAESEPLDATST